MYLTHVNEKRIPDSGIRLESLLFLLLLVHLCSMGEGRVSHLARISSPNACACGLPDSAGNGLTTQLNETSNCTGTENDTAAECGDTGNLSPCCAAMCGRSKRSEDPCSRRRSCLWLGSCVGPWCAWVLEQIFVRFAPCTKMFSTSCWTDEEHHELSVSLHWSAWRCDNSGGREEEVP